MAKVDELEKAAATADANEAKPLAELRSPMTRLPDEIRKIIAIRCRKLNKSFSRQTVELWVELLKKEKLVPLDLAIDFAKRGGGSGPLREKLTASEAKVAELEAELATLKAARK